MKIDFKPILYRDNPYQGSDPGSPGGDPAGVQSSLQDPAGATGSGSGGSTLSPYAAAAISGGVQLATSAANAIFQTSNNNAVFGNASDMYNRQRADALADWYRQNEYNSPSAQMARLRAAGLNPNLVYGHGADAQSTSMPRPASYSAPTVHAPQIDASQVGSAVSTYYDTEIKEATIDNLKKQNTVLDQEAFLKAVTAANVIQSTSTSQFDLGVKSDLRSTSIDMAKENLRKVGVDIDLANSQSNLNASGVMKNAAEVSYLHDKNIREIALNSATITETIQRALLEEANRSQSTFIKEKLRAEADNLDQSSQLKNAEQQMYNSGMSPSDSWPFRFIQKFLATVYEQMHGKGGDPAEVSPSQSFIIR